MATRSAAAQRADPRPVTGRVSVWKRVLVPVSEATNNLASFQWVQTGKFMHIIYQRDEVSSICDDQRQQNAVEVAPTSAERAAKRTKLIPIKDESVKPIPTRARSIFAVDTPMQDVKLEPSAVPDPSAAPSAV